MVYVCEPKLTGNYKRIQEYNYILDNRLEICQEVLYNPLESSTGAWMSVTHLRTLPKVRKEEIRAVRMTQEAYQSVLDLKICPYCGSTEEKCNKAKQDGALACCPECGHK